MFHLRAARKRIGLSPFCVRRVWSISSASHRNPPTIITTRRFPRSSTRCGSRDREKKQRGDAEDAEKRSNARKESENRHRGSGRPLSPATVAVGTRVNLAPPAQIRTGRIAAYGSYRRYLALKRIAGRGCRIVALGIHRATSGPKRSPAIHLFCLPPFTPPAPSPPTLPRN